MPPRRASIPGASASPGPKTARAARVSAVPAGLVEPVEPSAHARGRLPGRGRRQIAAHTGRITGRSPKDGCEPRGVVGAARSAVPRVGAASMAGASEPPATAPFMTRRYARLRGSRIEDDGSACSISPPEPPTVAGEHDETERGRWIGALPPPRAARRCQRARRAGARTMDRSASAPMPRGSAFRAGSAPRPERRRRRRSAGGGARCEAPEMGVSPDETVMAEPDRAHGRPSNSPSPDTESMNASRPARSAPRAAGQRSGIRPAGA